MDGETRYYTQTIDFLGFLRSQLSGLQGIPTLCYELIQNADDVKDKDGNPGGASRITFDVCDDALWVENDGEFREVDFNRMREISSGGKRSEGETIGSFGIGFISVYQITDRPELFSSGKHWCFNPTAEENQRITEKLTPTQGTRFRLPWAFENTEMRQRIGCEAMKRANIELYTEEIKRAIEMACLFLKQIRVLELKRNGKIIQRITTQRTESTITVKTIDSKQIWHVLKGNFSGKAQQMRDEYRSEIEEKRKSQVTIAVSGEKEVEGLLYAYLPSEMKTGLPFHINADFYPTPDRKRIIFNINRSVKEMWNVEAIKCAAGILAENAQFLLDLFGPLRFWFFTEKVSQASEKKEISEEFGRFWELFKDKLPQIPCVLTHSGQVLKPPETIFLNTETQQKADGILTSVGLKVVHLDLRGWKNLLLKVGVRQITLQHLVDIFHRNGWCHRAVQREEFPESLQERHGWEVFYQVVHDLHQNRGDGESLNQLAQCAVTLGSDGAFWPASLLVKADSRTRTLFAPLAADLIWMDDHFPDHPFESFIRDFDLTMALNVLVKSQSLIEGLWKEGRWKIAEICEWLKSRSRLHLSHVQRLRNYRIWPSADGSLKSLENLYLPGDFNDPLQMAQLIDDRILGREADFLENELQVKRLDFETYVTQMVPQTFAERELTRQQKLDLVVLLAENIGKIKTILPAKNTLGNLPLIYCGEEQFSSALDAYFRDDLVLTLLGNRYPIAEQNYWGDRWQIVRELYEWLGVADQPRPTHLLKKINEVISNPPDETRKRFIRDAISFLGRLGKWDAYVELKDKEWLPGDRGSNIWFKPSGLFLVFQNYLFESQAVFLDVDRGIQTSCTAFLSTFLGIRSDPDPKQVVDHLLFCSSKNLPVNQEVYTYLNRNSTDSHISRLRDKPCLYLKIDTGESKYLKPDQVFWEEHSFGPFRYKLEREFGKYKKLLDALGVKEKPDGEDAVKVLLEISERFGLSNFKLDEETKQIVYKCWEIIGMDLEEQKIERDLLQKALGNRKTIPDGRDILEPPSSLFFDDRPGFKEKFRRVIHNLIPLVEGSVMAMEAAGVRRMSNLVQTHLHECTGQVEDEDLKKLLQERASLIGRIIYGHSITGYKKFQLQALMALETFKAEKIIVIREFMGFQRREYVEEQVKAVVIGDAIYYCSHPSDGYPWVELASEMGFVLSAGESIPSLGVVLKEVFCAKSVEDAHKILDGFNFPPLPAHMSYDSISSGGTASTVENPPEIEIMPADENVDEQKTPLKNDEYKGASKQFIPSQKPKSRKRTRLISYVYPDDPFQVNSSDQSEHFLQRDRVSKEGVRLAMEFEKSQRRSPTDMEEVQTHHPGYDIESISEDGEIRYIEVKALSGMWSSQNPVQLTKNEFETARKFGEQYWLYVVEHVEDGQQPVIYKIQNPAARADYYLYDHGWLSVAL